MIPDVVDENEFSTGLRQEGVFSAGIAFAGKSTTIKSPLLTSSFIPRSKLAWAILKRLCPPVF